MIDRRVRELVLIVRQAKRTRREIMGNVFFHAARSATLAFVLVCVSGMALADWQGAVWNSSPKQAGKDFRIRHRAATQAEKTNWFGQAEIVFDNYRMGDLAFHKGALLFRDGKLREIWMSLKETLRCDKLIANLQATYGPADVSVLTVSRADLYTWHDQTHNNQIKVVTSEDMCDLNYQPLQDREDETR
jgi:hypothetical protein